MYAHLLNNIIAGHKFYMVVLTNDAELTPNKQYSGVFAANLDQAFDIAASQNVELLEGGKTLLQGDFNGKA